MNIFDAVIKPTYSNLKKIYEIYFEPNGDNKPYNNRYTVVMFWKDPINNGLNKRSGCFEEYFEASIFIDMLKETAKKFGYPFAIALNGHIEIDGGFRYEEDEDMEDNENAKY